jgi:hypothetical protein
MTTNVSTPRQLKPSRTTGLPAIAAMIFCFIANLSAHAQTGPFSPTNWPATIDTNSTADYYIVDPSATFITPGGWNPDITFAGGGDQAFVSATLDGLTGDQGSSSFMNIADGNYAQFANTPVVDILLQLFGDDTLYNTDGSGKNFTFREGALGTELPVSGGIVPPGANNGHWNWILFSITNAINPHPQNTTGLRYIGFVPTPAPPGTANGGVNGGTLRVEGVPGIAIRAVAIGPHGVFGTTNVVNAVFAPPAPCNPEPPINLASIDINAGVTNHLVVLNDTDQTVTYQNAVGPAGDLRRAVQASGTYMNFGILSNYLGQACNTPRPMKVCVEFYDDPLLNGAFFGPDMYATDGNGGTAAYTGPLYTLTGTGLWLKLAFWVQGVDLAGVNTGGLTGGPRLIFSGGSPFIDKIELGVVRSGTNVLAGKDPDPTFLLNPLICTTNYSYYVELDLQNAITNGLTTGNSGGDQQMVVELTGPAGDMRLSEAPTGGNNNLQFAIIPGASLLPPLGPTYQDNADVLMALTYYDDPAMVGARLYPWPYSTLKSGVNGITFPNQLVGTNMFGKPYSYRETLSGSGTWKVAYFELPNVNLAGVNQGPQSVARFQTDPATNGVPASGYIHVTRVRYDVVRPCGIYEGINMFQLLSINKTNPSVNVGWFGQATLQAKPILTGGWTDLLSVTNIVTNSYIPTPLSSQFFRLKFPPLPPLP